MSTKGKILELFELNKGKYFSGEEIAKKLCISRAAVWKAVKSLQSEGYSIDAVTNRGYCLSVKTDILSPQGVRKYLKPEYDKLDIDVIPTSISTNGVVRQNADLGKPDGYTVIANEQTEGRGRMGRSFFSPPDSGIYLSLLLRPENCESHQAVKITTIAAAAICEAIEAVSGETAQIKWVNDIYVRGKKVCGILTEASFSLENGLLQYAVLGVGINVYRPEYGFPKEIEQIAGYIFDEPCDDAKNRLSAELLNRFMTYYSNLGTVDYIEAYKRRNFVIGKRINVITAEESKMAFALDIDNECRLLVKYDDGKEEALSSGEISITF